MRRFWIGTAVYVTLVGGVIAGAAVAFNALVGLPTKGASNQVVAQMGPTQRTSGKWTPVEIKREATTPPAPPLPPYVSPHLTASNATPGSKQQPQIAKQRPIVVAERRTAARKPANKVIAARRGYDPGERQVLASYAAPEAPRFFGPFRFPF